MPVTCTVSPGFAAGPCECNAFRKSLSSICLPTSILKPFLPEGIGFRTFANSPETYRTISRRDCGCRGACLPEGCCVTERYTSGMDREFGGEPKSGVPASRGVRYRFTSVKSAHRASAAATTMVVRKYMAVGLRLFYCVLALR